jgi:Flp pilus assembly protein TadG
MKNNISSKEKGQSLVEMAISFTFLLVLVGGIVDLGMLFYTYLSLRDTAQEGAIYGSYEPTNTGNIIARVQASASWPIDASKITNITVRCNGNPCVTTNTSSCPGQAISVQVLYNYQPLLPMLSTITGGGPLSLNATVTDTILNSDPTIAYLKTLNQSCSP